MVRRIGSGGFGIVYEVIDRERDVRLALKTLARLEASALYRFKREFRALADVRHENLVRLYELVSEGDDWFFTMELVLGEDCLSYIRKERNDLRAVPQDAETVTAPLPRIAVGSPRTPHTPHNPYTPNTPPPPRSHPRTPPRGSPGGLADEAQELRLRETLRQLALGISALHGAGKLHRDIKPSNVLVELDGRVVVVDFGIATELRERGRGDFGSEANVIAGTPEYMAPEQAAAGPHEPSADWYAVGMVLYEALTGVLPFQGTPLEILVDKQRREPPSPRSVVADSSSVPRDLDELCMALLQTQPRSRPSGHEILRRLGETTDLGGRTSHVTSSPQRVPIAAQPKGQLGEVHALPRLAELERATTLVGRDRELAALVAACEASRGGKAVTMFVHGPSGVGKTALVRAFLDGVRRGAVVLAGRCYERESVPYKALDSVVDELSRYLLQLPAKDGAAVTPRDAGALVRLFPVLQRVAAIAEAPRRTFAGEIDAPKLRQRAFGALRELFARLCDRRQVIVFIDDLQWGDIDSAALLAELMAPPDAPALLVILGFRSEDEETSAPLRALLDAGGPRAPADRRDLAIDSLGPADAEALALLLLGEDADEELARSVARESDGNPLFALELVRYLQEDAEALRGSGLRLEKLLQKRLLGLAPEARRLLEIVSVAGRPIRLEIAAKSAQLEREARGRALDVLRASTLVRSAGTRATDILEPYHDRIREAVLTLMSEDELAERHADIARVLRATGETDPELLFLHFAAAATAATRQKNASAPGLVSAAAEYAEEAARKAEQALAFDRAAQFHRQALERLVSRGSDDPRARAVRVALAIALTNGGRGAEAAEAYLAAADGAPPEQRLELRRRAAEQLIISGHIDPGVAAIEAVLVQVGLRLPRTPLRALLGLVFARLWLAVRGLRFRERDPMGIPPLALTRIDVAWSLAAGLSVVDNILAANFQTHNLLACLRAGEPSRLSRALVLEAVFVALPGPSRRARAMRIIEVAKELATRSPQPDSEALLTLAQASVDYFTGQFRGAIVHSDRFLSLYQDGMTPTRWELRATQYFGLCAIIYTGELEVLRTRLPAYLREANDRGDLFLGTNLVVGETNLMWLLDDDDVGAARVVDEAMDRWSQRAFQVQHWYAMQSRAQIALYRGDGKAALAEVERNLPALQKSLLLRVQHTRIKCHWLRARCALAVFDIPLARVEARRVAREKAAWATPLAALIFAAIALREGDRKRAERTLGDAIAGLDAAELHLIAAVARLRLGALVGGADGTEIAERGRIWMTQKGIVRPEKIADLLAPGFDK